MQRFFLLIVLLRYSAFRIFVNFGFDFFLMVCYLLSLLFGAKIDLIFEIYVVRRKSL